VTTDRAATGSAAPSDEGEMMSKQDEIEQAMWREGGIGGLYGTDCNEAFRRGWKAALAARPDDAAARGEVERLLQALSDIQFDLINCHEAAGRNACAHIKDAIKIVNRALAAGDGRRGEEGPTIHTGRDFTD
jgi:hypothetical protein